MSTTNPLYRAQQSHSRPSSRSTMRPSSPPRLPTPSPPPSPPRTPSPIPVRPHSPIPSRPHTPQRPPSPPMRPLSPPRTRSPPRVQSLPPNLSLYSKQFSNTMPISVSVKKSETPKKQPISAPRSTPPMQKQMSSTTPSRPSNPSRTPSRTLVNSSTYASPTSLPPSTYASPQPKTSNSKSKSKSAPPSTHKSTEKKYAAAASEQDVRNVGEIIHRQLPDNNGSFLQNTASLGNGPFLTDPIHHTAPLYSSVQRNQVFDHNGKDLDTSHPHHPHNALSMLRDTVSRTNNPNANTTYNTTFNTTIHHQPPIATHQISASNHFNTTPLYTPPTFVPPRPQSPTKNKPQDNLLITFQPADGGEYVVPVHIARHSRIVSSTLTGSLATAAHRFEFSTVTAEVMGAVLRFLENPFVHFLNTRKGSLLLPSNPFQQVGPAKAILAGDAMEIPLVLVYCTSLLLAAGHTSELQKYLPTTFLFTRCPIADWFTLQDTVESLLPTTATHTTSPTVITTTTTRPSCENGMDFLWHVRFINDFGASDISYREAAGVWKRVYSESRVQSFLLAGLDQLDELELVNWKRHLAPLVQSLDLSESVMIHDGVVSLVLSLCTNLQRLDLHKSHITDESLLLIAEAGREGHELVWLNLQNTHVSREGVHSFSLCCPTTSIVI